MNLTPEEMWAEIIDRAEEAGRDCAYGDVDESEPSEDTFERINELARELGRPAEDWIDYFMDSYEATLEMERE